MASTRISVPFISEILPTKPIINLSVGMACFIFNFSSSSLGIEFVNRSEIPWYTILIRSGGECITDSVNSCEPWLTAISNVGCLYLALGLMVSACTVEMNFFLSNQGMKVKFGSNVTDTATYAGNYFF